jgi:hypothetical protein
MNEDDDRWPYPSNDPEIVRLEWERRSDEIFNSVGVGDIISLPVYKETTRVFCLVLAKQEPNHMTPGYIEVFAFRPMNIGLPPRSKRKFKIMKGHYFNLKLVIEIKATGEAREHFGE